MHMPTYKVNLPLSRFLGEIKKYNDKGLHLNKTKQKIPSFPTDVVLSDIVVQIILGRCPKFPKH